MDQLPRSPEDLFLAYRRTRDPQALAGVYDQVASRLLAVALHTSSSTAAAEDAVQDTFLIALEHPERWDPNRPLLPWLLGILSNRLRQSVHRATRTPDPARLRLPGDDDPTTELESHEVLDHIERAISGLAQPYRTVVLLRLRNGLSPADIAVALDRKPSTVRAQLTRGVEMLRKLLPAGVAGMLAINLATERGLAAVRQTIVERATLAEQAFHRELTPHGGGSWGVGLGAAVAVLAAAAWLGFGGTPAEPSPTQPAALRNIAPDATAEASVVRPITIPRPAPGSARAEVATTGGIRVFVEKNGRPLPNAPVELEPVPESGRVFRHVTSGNRGTWYHIAAGTPAPESALRHGRTDARGERLFDRLRPGGWIVRAVGVSDVVRVDAGESADLSLAAEPRSAVVRGLVLDHTDRPLAGVDIHACREHLGAASPVVARTNAGGRFEVAVAPYTTLVARRADYAPVGAAVGRDPTVHSAEVVLRLTTAGAEVTGRVLDATGQPAPGATIRIGHPMDRWVVTPAATATPIARPMTIRADEDGRFACSALQPGKAWLSAWAPGHGSTGQLATLAAGTTTAVTITLPAAATVTGVLRDAAGQPVEAALVFAPGAAGRPRKSTTTAGDGTFRLTDLTPGRVALQAVHYNSGAFATTIRDCDPGTSTTWNPVFDRDGLRISGQVLTASGQPFAGGWISATRLGGLVTHQLDDAGRFDFEVHERDARHPTTLLVYEHEPQRGSSGLYGVPVASKRGLVAGVRDVRIRIPATTAAPAWVRGRILGAADATVSLRAELPGRAWKVAIAPDPETGEFEVGPVPAGRYSVTVEQRFLRRFGPYSVASGDTLDLGDLRCRTGQPTADDDSARLMRRFAFPTPPTADHAEEIYVEVRDEQRRLVVARLTTGLLLAALPIGRFTLTASTASNLRGTLEFEVVAAQPPTRALLVPLRRD
ncbi:MAG: sigma-70 family RNA polymerase sigma factor [bacterium]|nr:sigma-70 family RNA polymerase sigma factor [bacterium]